MLNKLFIRGDIVSDFLNSFIHYFLPTRKGKTFVVMKKPEDILNYEKNKNLYFIFMRDYELENIGGGFIAINKINDDGYSDDKKQHDAIRLYDMMRDGAF